MLCLRRVLAVSVLCLAACAAYAFTFSYGEIFDVQDVQNKNGILLMPLTNGKYKNVKVLSKDVYRFLSDCRLDCHYLAVGNEFASTDYRQAFTREGMLIADVDFNQEIAVTFLVFKNKDGFSVKAPETVVFKDKKILKQVEQYLKNLAEKTL